MTFKTIIPRLAERSDEQLGLHIFEWVMQNRLDHKSVYDAGNVGDFCNKEMKRVHDGLESVAENWQDPEQVKVLVERFVPKRLAKDKYRPITRICYMYDALKGMYQFVTGEPEDKLTQTALFLGDKLRRASLAQPESVHDYQWQRETPRLEYVRILTSMRNRLSEETGLIYELGR